MKEILLVVSLDAAEDREKPVAIWPEEAWDGIELDSDRIWAVKMRRHNVHHMHDLTEEDFEEQYGWPLNIALKPGEKMVIRSDTQWEPVEEESNDPEAA